MPERYEVRADVINAVIHIRLWGYWNDAEADGYRTEMTKAVTQLARTGKPWAVIGDISKSPPQSAYTQRIRQELLTMSTQSGMTRVAYIVDSSLTKQQMGRLAQSSGATAAFFHDVKEAEAWVRSP